MARSVNKVILVGNLGAAPEVRTTNGSNRVATFSLATSRRWRTVDGRDEEKTEWHRVVAWNRPNQRGPQFADLAERLLAKGDKVYVEGRLSYRPYTDRDGHQRWSVEIEVQELELMAKAPAPGARERTPDRTMERAPAMAGATEASVSATSRSPASASARSRRSRSRSRMSRRSAIV